MKDPNDGTVRAFDVLGISTDASLVEVRKAYFKVLSDKSNRMNFLAASEAYHRLSEPVSRLQDELFCYQDLVGAPDQLSGRAEEFQRESQNECPVDDAVVSVDRAFEMQCIETFQQLFLRLLPMEFPR